MAALEEVRVEAVRAYRMTFKVGGQDAVVDLTHEDALVIYNTLATALGLPNSWGEFKYNLDNGELKRK